MRTVGNEELRQIAHSSTSYRTRVLLKGSSSHGSQTPSSSRAAVGYLQQPQHIREQDPELLRLVDKKLLSVKMDEHAEHDVHPGTFITLSVVYNIPFIKYKCDDHGMLDDESFDNLRFHYILNLVNAWRLTSRVRQHFGGNDKSGLHKD